MTVPTLRAAAQPVVRRERPAARPGTAPSGTAPASPLAQVLVEDRADGPVELLLHGAVDSWGGEWGVSALEVAAALAQHRDRDVVVRINSPGGEAWEGAAIHAALLTHPGRVDVVIEGIAASAASLVAMAGDTIRMHATATMMLHGPSVLVVGTEEDLELAAQSLQAITAALAAAYSARTGAPVGEWVERLRGELWLSADQALAEGLVDEVLPASRAAGSPVQVAAAVARARARSGTARTAPVRSGRSATVIAVTEPVQQTEQPEQLTQPEPTEQPEQLTQPEPTEQSTQPEPTEQPTQPEPTEPEPTEPEPTGQPDTVTVDREAYEALIARDAARAAADRDALVTAAVNDGRIPAARADHWRTLLAADPGAADVLASLSPVVPTSEIGHSRDTPPDASAFDTAVALFPRIFGGSRA